MELISHLNEARKNKSKQSVDLAENTFVGLLKKETPGSLFDAIDTDGTGSIDKAEFGVLFEMAKRNDKINADKVTTAETKTIKVKKQRKGLVVAVVLLIVCVVLCLVANFGLSIAAITLTRRCLSLMPCCAS